MVGRPALLHSHLQLLLPAAIAPLVAPQVSEVESATLPAVMLSQPGLGLSLSPATSPFPQKLVDRARSGQFVDMRDLLTDNVSLIQQLDTFGNHTFPLLPGMLRPRLREVTSLPSWIYCFLAYIAIRAKGHCTFPGTCRFRHACATCQQPHMARDCVATPAHSEYKLGGGGRNPASRPGPRTPLLMWQASGA